MARERPNGDSVPADEVAVLRALVEGTAGSTGEDFFRNLVRNLARALDVRHAFVAEFTQVRTRVRTLAYWCDGRVQDNIEFDLAGTPCEEVVRGQLCHHPSGTWQKFPLDRPLAEMGIDSYLGVPLRDGRGEVLGHLAVFDERPMPAEPRKLFTFHIFAARAAAELERLRYEARLRESEARYRDLFDEAPIGYVQEDLQSRFLSANRTAQRILGLKPEEVVGTVGLSLVPPTPEAQRRVREAFAAVARGGDAGGFVLELRRKDDGRPVWVQWWSRPEPNGTYTRTVIQDVTERVLMEQQNQYLQEEIKADHNFEEIIGQSAPLAAVLDNVRRVAPTDASVLIHGETGTGKELIARALHSASKRKDKPLIKLNCAALPGGLVESELFGHEKGAFTGALARRVGRFELAHGGTIFLDEVSEIPLEAQAKLLRVLQEREFERLGGGTPVKVDVRVIAATNRDPLKAVREGTLREDLYYRLNVFPLVLPPLRQRAGDIPLLAHFFLGRFAARVGKRLRAISPDALERLKAYPWPGNIRELENLLERAVILAQGDTLNIGPELLGPAPAASASGPPSEPGFPDLATLERDHIRAALERADWIIDGPRGAARLLGLHPNTLRSRMKKLNLRRGRTPETSD